MGHSSLLGIERAAPEPAGRDTAALGPGDSSDSGSDMAGLDDEGLDPGVPADVALRDDQPHPWMDADSLGGAASDAAGSGERRSAAGDGGREAADIGVDRVFTPGAGDDGGAEPDDEEDAELAFVDAARADAPVEDDEENDDADEDGENDEGAPRGRAADAGDDEIQDVTANARWVGASTRWPAQATTAGPVPGSHPNPEPDPSTPPPSQDEGAAPGGDDRDDPDDAQSEPGEDPGHRPGRTSLAAAGAALPMPARAQVKRN